MLDIENRVDVEKKNIIIFFAYFEVEWDEEIYSWGRVWKRLVFKESIELGF